MDEMLFKYFTNNINNKKLKRSRLKRNMSLIEVSEKTGIPFATLRRYEDGTTKKIPLDAIKKISEVYGTDYKCYYRWTSFPFFGTLGGILISLFFGISIDSIYNGGVIGGALGLLGLNSLNFLKVNFDFDQHDDEPEKIIYNSLTKEEQKSYNDFLSISKTLLKTDELLDVEEKKDVNKLLFATFMLHNIRKKTKRKIIDFENAEVLENINNDNN